MKLYATIGIIFWVLTNGLCQESKPNIVYIFDPLCSWCYTFSPVMEKLQNKYSDKINFTVVTGGMLTGSSVRPISVMADFILEGHKSMEERSGVDFGESYLKLVQEGSLIMDSEKPCKAVVAFRIHHPEKAVSFSHELQRQFFLKGSSLNEDSTYRNLAEIFGMNEDVLISEMNSDSTKQLLLADFRKAEEANVTGFPTVLLRMNGDVIVLSRGFESFDKLNKKIEKSLKKQNK